MTNIKKKGREYEKGKKREDEEGQKQKGAIRGKSRVECRMWVDGVQGSHLNQERHKDGETTCDLDHQAFFSQFLQDFGDYRPNGSSPLPEPNLIMEQVRLSNHYWRYASMVRFSNKVGGSGHVLPPQNVALLQQESTIHSCEKNMQPSIRAQVEQQIERIMENCLNRKQFQRKDKCLFVDIQKMGVWHWPKCF